MKRALFVLTLTLVLAGLTLAEVGVKKKRPLPPDYGKVIIKNHSEAAGLAPVAFDHWLHRANFTCRLCHVDLAFAMNAQDIDIRAIDNMRGYFCGTCHNGRMIYDKRKVFESCAAEVTPETKDRCERCHSVGLEVKKEHDFAEFSRKLPRERFGNGIDWEKADDEGLIKPVDFLPGVSVKRASTEIQKDISLEAKVEGMPDIVFSHKKHTVWNGCELCHPRIFIGVKKGRTHYSMTDISDGKFCGVCHGLVAFPLLDCQRCHAKPVGQPAQVPPAPPPVK
ncbi:MAG TPA: c(7)-type cytochrome triheme domain-containing protein [Dissulfurispiraceae bacterium]|nr:c(7)-type cytochrome triheme domain-containing protein [Dissulfurispiraceae bacterium]